VVSLFRVEREHGESYWQNAESTLTVYEVVLPDPVAQEQIANLPSEALPYLGEVFTLLEVAPWAGRPSNPSKPNGNLRLLPFGERGLVAYLVLEPQP
jgi:hypothetical protein